MQKDSFGNRDEFLKKSNSEHMTKDERFLLEIYRAIHAAQDADALINPQTIAKNLGYKELLLKDILKGLRQANLIKIYSAEEVALTERGVQVARSLLGS